MIDLSQLLAEQFKVSAADIDKAKSYQSRYDGRLEQILVNMGCLTEDDLAPLYSKLLGYPLFSVDDYPNWQLPEGVDVTLLQSLKELDCVLLEAGDVWTLACKDPLSLSLAQFIQQHDVDVNILVATESQLQTFFYEIQSTSENNID